MVPKVPAVAASIPTVAAAPVAAVPATPPMAAVPVATAAPTGPAAVSAAPVTVAAVSAMIANAGKKNIAYLLVVGEGLVVDSIIMLDNRNIK